MTKVSVKDRVRKWRDKQKQEGGRSISIVLNANSSRELENIKERSRLNTISEVVNEAISLYKLLLEKEAQGFDVWVIPKKSSENELKAERICLSQE